jgi:hypothetical protein
MKSTIKGLFLSAAIILSVFTVCQGCKADNPVIIDPDDGGDSTTLSDPLADPIDWTVIQGRDQVVLLIRRGSWTALETRIVRYKEEVEARFPVQLNILKGSWTKPAEVRQTIREIYEKKGLTGVVLVGDMPLHRFYMHDFANPNALYYEDFTLPFSHDEIALSYTGEPNPKVWVANLRAVSDPTDPGIDQLKEFFDKTHSYYSGEQVIRHKALFAAGWEWPGGAKEASEAMESVFSGPDRMLLINETGKTSTAEHLGATRTNIMNAMKENFKLLYIQVHSWEAGHDVDHNGKILAPEIAALPTGALIVINHGCSAGNWLKATPALNTSQAYVFGAGIGQAVVCQVRTGMVYGHEKIYESLVAGDYLGKAYLDAKKAAELEMYREYPDGTIFSGVTFIGNPFLYLKIK